jgi:hypothetical protein
MPPVGTEPNVPTQPLAKSATDAAAEHAALVTRQPGNAVHAATDVNRHLALFSTRYASYVPAGLPAQSPSAPAFGVLPTNDGGQVVWAVR